MKKTPKAEGAAVADTLKIFYKATVRYKVNMVLSLLLPLGNVLLSVAVPYCAGKVLAGIVRPDTNLTGYLVGLGIFSFLGVLFDFLGFTRMMTLQARALADLHTKLFERLLQRSVGFHVNRISGKLISDVIDFVAAYGSFMSSIITTCLPFLSTLTIGIIVVFLNSWQLGLFLTFVVATTLAWAIIDSRTRSGLRNKRLIATKHLTSHLSDSIVNAQTVKTFARERFEMRRNTELNGILRSLRVRDWQRAGRSANARMAVLLAMQFCMIVLVVHLARQDPAILGAGIFALTYTLNLTNRLYELNTITRQLEEVFLNASPITHMLNESIEITDAPGATKLQVSHGAIALDAVSFAYADNTHDVVLKDLTLAIEPGQKIGLVGPSGGGKSTLTRLLLRFEDIQKGTISIDGQNIALTTQTSLRQNTSYVPQEPLLFHRSIRENIAYGKPKASTQAIIAAAKKAHAHDFISALPHGYDTIVGERGVKLSGGQRQRVAIARAILKDAPILVLDEATSALDSESEKLIQTSLDKLMRGRTTLVIAHRLSTIQKMDRIVVLNEGRIVEQGTHAELIKQKGMYAKLWSHQSGGFLKT